MGLLNFQSNVSLEEDFGFFPLGDIVPEQSEW
jgi:hypothetical protein